MDRWVLSDDPSDWLNWIQGLTTLALAVLTAVYVKLTARLATASVKQAQAASDAAMLAQRQLDMSLLDVYAPLLSAASATLGQVRACEMCPPGVPLAIVPTAFTASVGAAERIGGATAATMRMLQVVLEQAQNHKDELVSRMKSHPETEPFVQYHRESLKLMLDALQPMLQAMIEELSPIVEKLRASSGRTDLKFDNLTVPKDGAA